VHKAFGRPLRIALIEERQIWNGSKLRARPMGAFVRRAEGLIYFFTDARVLGPTSQATRAFQRHGLS
jgi:hypothetical protein